MTLIKCAECGKDVSDKAINCPNCGYPISPSRPAGFAPVLIEQTGKETKMLILLSVIIFLIGLALMGKYYSNGANDPSYKVGVLFAIGGTLGFVFGKVAKWWYYR